MTNTRRSWALMSLAYVLLVPGTGVSCNAQVAPPRTETFERTQGSLPVDWRVISGDWSVQDGMLIADSLDSESYITFGDEEWQNYEVSATVEFRKIRNRSRWLALLIRATRDGTTPWSQVPVRFDATQANGVEFAVRTKSNSWSIRSKAAAKELSALNKSRELRVTVRGTRVDAYLDDQHVLTSEFCVDRPTGCLGLGVSGCIAAFDNVSVRLLPETDDVDSPPNSPARAEVVAHRGFSAVAPENTLAAIRAAIEAGATGCEFDVYASRDGHVVLMHDKTVDRTTNGTGNVSQFSLKQLQSLDAGSWKHPRYRGERVPTLKEALLLLKGTNCQPVIEIKMDGIAEQVVKDVRALDMMNDVAVIAFSREVVREIRALEPEITCAWLCSKTPDGTVAERADWLQAEAGKCKTRLLDLNYQMLSPELIAELKKRKLGVWTWTVNEVEVMQALQQWGIDSITTDRPDLLPPAGR